MRDNSNIFIIFAAELRECSQNNDKPRMIKNETNMNRMMKMISRIRALLTLFLLMMGTTMSWAEFKDFAINLTEATAATDNPNKISTAFLPADVEQIFYDGDRTAKRNGGQHGWEYAAFQFDVDGPVDIIIGCCQHSEVDATVTDTEDNILKEWSNTRELGCGGIVTYKYTGGKNTLKVYCGQYCPTIKVQKASKEDFEATWDWTKELDALYKEISVSSKYFGEKLLCGVAQLSIYRCSRMCEGRMSQ